VGAGLDVGGKPDPLVLYAELFPLVQSIRTWDREDGDGQYLHGVGDASYDFVHSSHCLEHLEDPEIGLKNWFRVVRPGGHVIFSVPDEDLYEQRIFPSTFNKDHKWTFTVFKIWSWSERSINILDLVRKLGDAADIARVQLLNETYRYSLPRYDQTITPVGEAGIEVIIRKRTEQEVKSGGLLPRVMQPAPELRVHYNQYRDDKQTLMSMNPSKPPFQNDSEL